MPRAKENLEKVTIRLRNGDKASLDEFYPSLGHNRVIRKLVCDHVKNLEAKLENKRNQNDDDDDDINPADIAGITLD